MSIGVIGCGYVFDHYMATWKRHPGLVLKGVADIDANRRDVVARAYDLRPTPATTSFSPIPRSTSSPISPASRATSK